MQVSEEGSKSTPEHVAGGFVSTFAAWEGLTGTALRDREEEVVRLISHGSSNKQIAARLAPSTNKVFKTIPFLPEVALKTSYLNDVRFDPQKGKGGART
jgi:hypothetical protein